MIRLLMIGLLLIYFWYFYFAISKPLPLAVSEQALPPPAAPQLSFAHSNEFKFTINNREWTHTIPIEEPYIIYNDRIIDKVECKYIPDEESVEATGKALYDYFKEHQLSEEGTLFTEDVTSILHTGQKFYFKCKNGIIDNLHTCPARTIYSNKTKSCVPIDDCIGQPDNIVLRHKTEIDRYISCQKEVPIEKMCPPNTFFMQNRCYPLKQVVTYCQNNTEPFLVNEFTKLVCVYKHAYFIQCPPNTKFFDKDGECEPLDCVGRPDHFKIPLPEKDDGTFKYVPGFKYCKDERVSKTSEMCPTVWEDSPHHLPNVPMVFYNGKCQAPIFCENLFSDEAIVPLANFTKVLPRWSHSEAYDSLQGVKCVKRKLQVVNMPPGYRIKKFKQEKADDIFPIQGNVTKFYDPKTDTVQDCPQKEHFNGSKCVSNHPFAFKHQGIDIFKFNNLNKINDWLITWHYTNEPKNQPCPATEPVYLSAYNKCSDTDCAKYPFLTQLKNFSILENNFKCTFSGTSIKKEPIDDAFSFWKQRINDPSEDECTPGQNIVSGNFIWDKTVYATCDKDQPFVFCPSSTTQGIEILNDKKYACKPPQAPLVEPFHLTTRGVTINTHEIKSIKPLYDKVEIDYHDGKGYVPLIGEKILPEGQNLTLSARVDGYVQLEHRYKLSYPPDVYYKDGIGHPSENYRAWLIKAKGYTEKPVSILDHDPEMFIEDYN